MVFCQGNAVTCCVQSQTMPNHPCPRALLLGRALPTSPISAVSHATVNTAVIWRTLRDRLVCGIHNNAICKRLLPENNLDLKKAKQLATAVENAARASIKRTRYGRGRSSIVKTETVSSSHNKAARCHRLLQMWKDRTPTSPMLLSRLCLPRMREDRAHSASVQTVLKERPGTTRNQLAQALDQRAHALKKPGKASMHSRKRISQHFAHLSHRAPANFRRMPSKSRQQSTGRSS